ncbi:MAG: hypothetical protein PHT46_02115, partial [Candidatus Marinimicrobia bacterium]|nr:hypothetical protein [Candidatus Neomarinimicrobiota bacterium]
FSDKDTTDIILAKTQNFSGYGTGRTLKQYCRPVFFRFDGRIENHCNWIGFFLTFSDEKDGS